MRRIVPMLCAALMACSGGDAADRPLGTAATAPASVPERLLGTAASLTGGAVISHEGHSTVPQLESSPAGEPAGDRSFSTAKVTSLPPAIAATLEAEPFGQGVAPSHALRIMPTPTGEWIDLLFGGTSVVDAELLTPQIGEYVPEASPAAPMQSLR